MLERVESRLTEAESSVTPVTVSVAGRDLEPPRRVLQCVYVTLATFHDPDYCMVPTVTTTNANDREFHVVIIGAAGFTGRLVAEHLLNEYGADGGMRWAIAGRDEHKLKAMREELGPAASNIPLIVADARDPSAMKDLARRARVVCSTVGPASVHCNELIAACASEGTSYCDLAGEPHWIRRMSDAHGETARNAGARLVHCCGYASVPSDIGCLLVNEEMKKRHGGPCESVKTICVSMNGSFSGGTWHTILNGMKEVSKDPEARKANEHPYGINPHGAMDGPDGPDQVAPSWDDDMQAWTTLFMLGPINTRIVRRSHALMGFPWGRDFRYSESLMTGKGPVALGRAFGETAGGAVFQTLASIAPTRAVLGAILPAPGRGPSKARRDRGDYEFAIIGKRGDRTVRCRVYGTPDPGYGATSRMIGECAVSLAVDSLPSEGGSLTPAAAFGSGLVSRLQNSAGMSFTFE